MITVLTRKECLWFAREFCTLLFTTNTGDWSTLKESLRVWWDGGHREQSHSLKIMIRDRHRSVSPTLFSASLLLLLLKNERAAFAIVLTGSWASGSKLVLAVVNCFVDSNYLIRNRRFLHAQFVFRFQSYNCGCCWTSFSAISSVTSLWKCVFDWLRGFIRFWTSD